MPFLIGVPLLRKIPDPPLGHLFKMHIVLGVIKSVISLRGCMHQSIEIVPSPPPSKPHEIERNVTRLNPSKTPYQDE